LIFYSSLYNLFNTFKKNIKKDKSKCKESLLNPKIMMGKPVVAGTRITVEFILEKLSNGESIQQIIKEYRNWTEKLFLQLWILPQKHLRQMLFIQYMRRLNEVYS
jgi:uncharacterized protein (DUF433 family)